MNASSVWLALVRTLAVVFAALGVLLIAWPRVGSILFGLGIDDVLALAYVRALGFRDLALSVYLLVLSWTAPRACRAVLGVSVLIPACDLILVMGVRGVSAPGSLLLHAASGVCLATLALWPHSRDRALR